MSKKTKGWTERLIEFVDLTNGQDFEWGTNDCVALTLACMSVMTRDDQHRLIATWDDAPSARRTLEAITPESYLTEIGCEQIETNQIISGDILTGMRDHLPTCHVVVGRQILSSWIDEGVTMTPINYDDLSDLKAWRLPI